MSKADNRLTAVVAGWKWGAHHARAFAESEHADLKALWSRSAHDKADKLARLHNIPRYTDFDRMLRELTPDIVSVAVPEAAHEALTLRALNAGCHVYCEKVLAPSRDAAQRMVDTAKAKNRILNVGYNYRYSPSCQYVTHAVKQGRIGQPLFALLRAFGCCIHHMTDYAGSLLGTPVRAVALINKEPLPGKPHPFPADLVFPTFMYNALTLKTYMIEYDTGAVLMAGATDYSAVFPPGAELVVQGSEGRVMLNDLTGEVTLWGKSREATLYKPSQICDRIGLSENCVAAVKDFARAAAAGEPAPIPGEAGVAMIAAEEAVFRSAQTGVWETV
ncbi:MAG: Gfo/Idh/MocA family oxidoreductase [Kiritimatiellae bacterium]|nr:Gfo/Idh/MocA family oxidoreductase [Kiritimatiellia bacterium]